MRALDFQSRFDVLRADYARNLPLKIHDLETGCRALERSHVRAARLAALAAQAHQLAGSGATFGYPEITVTARALELYLKALQDTLPWNNQSRIELQARLARLEQAAARVTPPSS